MGHNGMNIIYHTPKLAVFMGKWSLTTDFSRGYPNLPHVRHNPLTVFTGAPPFLCVLHGLVACLVPVQRLWWYLPFGDGKHTSHKNGDLGDGLYQPLLGFYHHNFQNGRPLLGYNGHYKCHYWGFKPWNDICNRKSHENHHEIPIFIILNLCKRVAFLW